MLSTSARVIARVRPRIAHRRVQHRLRPVFGVLHKLGLPVSAGAEMERWEEMWARGLDPGDAFDCEKNEPAFQDLIDKDVLPKGKALVPGCGRGYACCALARAGNKVVGMDISKTACKAAEDYRDSVGLSSSDIEYVAGNFFEHEGSYDIVYDCTFYCAIEPSLRSKWAAKMRDLVKPGGELVTLIFPVAEYDGGPPFACSTEQMTQELQAESFKRIHLAKVEGNNVARPFKGEEWIARWQHST